MASELSKELSKVVHRMGMEREDRIISGKTKLTVTTIFLMDDNWTFLFRYDRIAVLFQKTILVLPYFWKLFQ